MWHRLQILLLPLAAVYAAVMDVRNLMFDRGWLRSLRPTVRSIGIGNLAVGGTGKTPHTELIAAHYRGKGLSVAILSRGYGRRTKGFRYVTPQSTADEVGDEPLQMFRRFGGKVCVAVGERRAPALLQLEEERHPQAVVLDDVFQHRYVKPHTLILLTDYARRYDTDHVLPAGRLRERRAGARRADIIIVTKCPPELAEAERQDIIRHLAPHPRQQVFFTAMQYAPLTCTDICQALLITGIAHPAPLEKHLRTSGITLTEHLNFPDHHRFSATDIRRITVAAARAPYIITTAKDFQRLAQAPLPEEVKRKVIVQDITVSVLFGEEEKLKALLP